MKTIEQLKAELEIVHKELVEANKKNIVKLGRAERCLLCKNQTSSNSVLCLTHLSERNNTRDNHLANHRLFVFTEKVNIE